MRGAGGDPIKKALRRWAKGGKRRQSSDELDDQLFSFTQAQRVLNTNLNYTDSTFTVAGELYELQKEFKVHVLGQETSKKREKCRRRNRKLLSRMKNTDLSSLPHPEVVLFPAENVQLGWKGSVPVGCGFQNQGTTCYINSTLQALFHVPSFVNWLLGDQKHHQACEKAYGLFQNECTVCAVFKTLQASLKSSTVAVKPNHIINKLKGICKHLSPHRQEDAHEFLRYLIEAMEKSYISILHAKKLDNFSKETTPLNQIFGGYIRTEVTCLECKHVSTTFQHFQDLILDIRQHSTSSVSDALENYFSNERLDGDESYHCERCKKKVSAYKKFSIERAPNALCIQLKRFNINSFYGGSKISKSISIQPTIDLSKFKHKKVSLNGGAWKYKLMSMVLHHGASVNSGHYTAVGYTASGSYYYFNDEQVHPTNIMQHTNSSLAYIMFYELERTSRYSESSSELKVSSSTYIVNPNNTQRSNSFLSKQENSSFISYSTLKRPSLETVRTDIKRVKPIPVAKPSVFNAFDPSTSAVKTSPIKSPMASKSLNTANTAKPMTTVKTETRLVPYMSSDDSDADDNALPSSQPSLLAKKNVTLTSLLSSKPLTSIARPARLELPPRSEPPSSLELPSMLKSPSGDIPAAEQRETTDSPKRPDAATITLKRLDTLSTIPKRRTESLGAQIRNNARALCRQEKEIIDGWTVTPIEASPPSSTPKSNTEWTVEKTDENQKITENGIDEKKAVSAKCNGNAEIVHFSHGAKHVYSNKNNNCVNGNNINKSSNYSNGNSSNKSNNYTNGNNDNNDSNNNGSSNNYKTSNYSNGNSNKVPNNRHNSLHGYGANVKTWNGDISYINKQVEQDIIKRNIDRSCVEEEDVGKVKKMKLNRTENGPSTENRPNLIQQYHNNYNSHNNNNCANNRPNGRPFSRYPYNYFNGNHRRFNYHHGRRNFYNNGYNNYNSPFPARVHQGGNSNWSR